jgi:hypothetical protein
MRERTRALPMGRLALIDAALSTHLRTAVNRKIWAEIPSRMGPRAPSGDVILRLAKGRAGAAPRSSDGKIRRDFTHL